RYYNNMIERWAEKINRGSGNNQRSPIDSLQLPSPNPFLPSPSPSPTSSSPLSLCDPLSSSFSTTSSSPPPPPPPSALSHQQLQPLARAQVQWLAKRDISLSALHYLCCPNVSLPQLTESINELLWELQQN